MVTVAEFFKIHGPYEPVPPFEWPTPGQQTWQAPERSVFPGCNDRKDCPCACAVGVRTVGSGVYGCDCHGHDAQRERLVQRS